MRYEMVQCDRCKVEKPAELGGLTGAPRLPLGWRHLEQTSVVLSRADRPSVCTNASGRDLCQECGQGFDTFMIEGDPTLCGCGHPAEQHDRKSAAGAIDGWFSGCARCNCKRAMRDVAEAPKRPFDKVPQ